MAELLQKFKESCQTARNKAYNYKDFGYSHTDDEKLAIDTVLKLMMTPAIEKRHPFFSNVNEEYRTGYIPYSSVYIHVDSNNRPIEYYENGNIMWEEQEGKFGVGAIRNKRPLSPSESRMYPGFYGSTTDDTLYNPTTHQMLKRFKSTFKSAGIISMSSAAKGDTDTSRQHNICTPLNFIYNFRLSEEYKALRGDSFMGGICRTSQQEVLPYFIQSAKYAYRTQGEKRGYWLSDYYVVIDIDNGCQIDNIKKAFSEMPTYLCPQIIIQERGFEGTKFGNASALIFFDEPLNSEQRRVIINKIRWYLMYEANVFAVDSKCTGANLFKNPVKQTEEQCQRCTAIHDVLTPRKLSSALNLLTIGVNEDHSQEADIEKWIIKNNLKYSEYTYSQLVEMYNNSDNTPDDDDDKPKTEFDTDDIIPVGVRNDTAIVELSSMMLQEYNRIGFSASFLDANTPKRVCDAIYPIILETYDNIDNQTTYKWVFSRLLWCYKRDMNLYRSPELKDRKELFVAASKQRMYMLRYNKHQLMDAYNLPCQKESDLAKMPELDGIYITDCTYDDDMRKHGADTNKLKAILWVFASCKGDIASVLREMKYICRDKNLDLTNKTVLDSVYCMFVDKLRKYKDKDFTIERIREASEYLTTYLEAEYRMNTLYRINSNSPRLLGRMKTDEFRFHVSSHLLYDEQSILRCYRSMVNGFINFRDNCKEDITCFDDITRKSGINKAFAKIYQDHKLDWSSCAIIMKSIHTKCRNAEKDRKLMRRVSFRELYSEWSAHLLETAINITLSQLIKFAYDEKTAYMALRGNCIIIDGMNSIDELIEDLHARTGMNVIYSKAFIKLLKQSILEYQEDTDFYNRLMELFHKFITYVNMSYPHNLHSAEINEILEKCDDYDMEFEEAYINYKVVA